MNIFYDFHQFTGRKTVYAYQRIFTICITSQTPKKMFSKTSLYDFLNEIKNKEEVTKLYNTD